MATKKGLLKVAAKYNATVVTTETYYGSFGVHIAAPHGYHWACRGVHTLFDHGCTAAEAYDAAIRSMGYGIERCSHTREACIDNNEGEGGWTAESGPLIPFLVGLTDDQKVTMALIVAERAANDPKFSEWVRSWADGTREMPNHYPHHPLASPAHDAVVLLLDGDVEANQYIDGEVLWVLEHIDIEELDPIKDAVLAGEVRWLMDWMQSTA
jgi:hypothetical protein